MDSFQFINLIRPFKNLKKQPAPSNKLDKQEGIIKWQVKGGKNNYPQQLIQNVNNSPSGNAALDVWTEYVTGDGLLDSDIGEMEVNRTETLNDLHAKLAQDLTTMWGLAILIRYFPDGKPSSFQHLPFEETRLGIADGNNINRIFHNPYYGIPGAFKPEQTIMYYDYTPKPQDQVKQREAHNTNLKNLKDGEIFIKYPGQVFWFSIEQPLARIYPQPFYYSSINWFQVDAEIQSFHERNIKNNLLLSVLINMYGDPSKPAGRQSDNKDTTDKTEDQNETLGDQVNTALKSFQDQKGGAFLNWFKHPDEKATFEAFPTNSHHDLFIALQQIVADQIAIGTKVPRVLLNIATAGKLGDSQDILNAVRIMQGRTTRMRNILTRIYEKVLGIEDGTIKNVNPVNIIPDLVWQALTLKEQRNYIEKNFDIELLENGEVEEPKEDEIIEDEPVAKVKDNGSNRKDRHHV